jgi:outer membrane lipoprotein-sorting protein
MRVIPLVAAFFLFWSQSSTQQSATVVQRDPQATALMQGSVRAMGGNAPSDSVATGSINIVAGPQTSTGTIRILTAGTDQTSEQITLPQSTRTVTYSHGMAAETNDGSTLKLSVELMTASQSSCFPLPFLADALSNSDETVSYVGQETLDARQVQHLRLTNTFASKPTQQFLAEFTTTNLWIDATTALPVRISTVLRAGRGSAPRVPLDVYFSNYQTISGVAYPFTIQKSLNGTPWTTISINTVAFNTGLTDSSFSVQ